MKTQYLLTIKAEDRPGLIHQITGRIEKRQIHIKSLNAAATDIHDIVVITLEIEAYENDLAVLVLKLEKIIEIYAVKVTRYDEAVCLRVAYFKMDKAFLETSNLLALQKHNASILASYPAYLLIAKYGTDQSIRSLYNELDGPLLLSFTQTGLIADQTLIEDTEERVMGQFIYNLVAA